MDRMAAWQGETRRVRLPLGNTSWMVAVLLALVAPLSFVAAGTSVLPGDVAISRAVQAEVPGAFGPLIAAANLLGSTPSMLAIALAVSAVLLVKDQRRSALIVGAATLAQAANLLLKLTLESPRPTSGLVHVSEQTTGYGFPSGHTMGTTVLALALVYVAGTLMAAGYRRRIVQASLLLLPLVVGLSRIETGAHWPSDVLGAWLWGALAAIAVVTLSQHSWNRFSLPASRPMSSLRNMLAIPDNSGD